MFGHKQWDFAVKVFLVFVLLGGAQLMSSQDTY